MTQLNDPPDVAVDRGEEAGSRTPAAPEPATAPSWREIVRGRGRLTAGLVLVELVAGIEALVVAAAMPNVLRDIGGLAFYGATFSGYMLAGLVSIPRVGRTADRDGPAPSFTRMGLWFMGGTVIASLAPTMPLLAAARVVQGYGGGALYMLAYGTVNRAYPERSRPRVLALLTMAWVLAGIAGPPYGALLSSTVGWRWAFASVLVPTVVAALLVLPELRMIRSGNVATLPIPARWPLQLAGGSALVLGGAASATWWGAAVAVAGVAAVGGSLRHVLPPGVLRGAPGLPAAVAVSFLLNASWFTTEGFLPLLLTGVRGRSVAEAGVALTLATLSWCLASLWQARAMTRYPARTLILGGTVTAAIGVVGVLTVLAGAPVLLAYASMTLGGAGMGVAYPTVMLVAMGEAGQGGENTAMAARFVGGRLGVVAGTGLGGASIAVAVAVNAPLRAGLAAAFAIALASAVLSSVCALRFSRQAG